MKQILQNHKGLVQKVFDRVSNKYDVMNDFMSLGIHRLWKKDLIYMMSPYKNTKLIDVGCGTGDIGKLFLESTNYNSYVYNVDPNRNMINAGKKKFKNINNIKWFVNSAENLRFEDNFFDFYTISYGIRNVSNINLCLKEAFRVLKPGGRIMILEFSTIPNKALQEYYDLYSFKIIPKLGELITKDKKSYEYLVESIRKFPDQETFSEIIKNCGFQQVKYRNLSLGISALHSGWKV